MLFAVNERVISDYNYETSCVIYYPKQNEFANFNKLRVKADVLTEFKNSKIPACFPLLLRQDHATEISAESHLLQFAEKLRRINKC